VAGHLHPAAKVTSGRATIRRRCFVTDGSAPGPAGLRGLHRRAEHPGPAFAPLFGGPPLAAALGPRRVHAVGWKSLRPD
jgi:metallophosphoesterase superfamily enzyme